MNKKYLIGGIVAILIIGGAWALFYRSSGEPRGSSGYDPMMFRSGTYVIEGTPVTLVNDLSVTDAAPGSASKVTTRYFGNNAYGDLNGDGKDDAAFYLTQSTGGTGLFYYIAVALKTDTGYTGTNAILIGDRIAPQMTEIRDGVVVANYADRAPEEPMATPPSIGTSRYFHVVDGKLVEIPKP